MEEKEKEECYLFTIQTDYNNMINCWFEEFPTYDMLMTACRHYHGNSFSIINVTKLTREQYEKLTNNEIVQGAR